LTSQPRKLNLIQAQNGTRVALNTLEKAVGVTLSFSQVPEIAPKEETRLSLPKIDPYATALQKRPELVSLDDSRKAAEEFAKAAAGQARPSISIQERLLITKMSSFQIAMIGTYPLLPLGGCTIEVK